MEQKMRCAIIMVLLAALILELTACQKNQESVLLTSIGDPSLESLIEQNSDSASEPYEVPERWSESIDATITLDSPIVIPDTSQFPVAVTANTEISQETADQIIQALLGDIPLCESASASQRTKEDVYADIAAEQRTFIEGNDSHTGKDLNLAANTSLFSLIKNLEEQYVSAPESIESTELTPANTIFHSSPSNSVYDANHMSAEQPRLEIDGQAVLADGREAYLNIDQKGYVWFRALKSDIVPLSARMAEQDYAALLPIIANTITQDQAKDQALSLIAATGLDYLALTAHEDGYIIECDDAGLPVSKRLVTLFYFMRNIDAVAENYTCLDRHFDVAYPNTMGYHSETAFIAVAEEGVVGFTWWRPTVMLEAKSNNVKLLEFTEIQNIFRSQILMSYYTHRNRLLDEQVLSLSFFSPADEWKPRLVIDQIKLGMMRVPRYGHGGEYLLIPVWDFYGHFASPEHEWGLFETDQSSKYHSYLTINAIDGSIIDRSTGY